MTGPTTEVLAGGDCHTDWCKPGAVLTQAQRLLDSQVDALTARRDCWAPDARPGAIPATVVVRGAKVDKTVAWELTLDDAFAVNRDGDRWNDVVVVKACS